MLKRPSLHLTHLLPPLYFSTPPYPALHHPNPPHFPSAYTLLPPRCNPTRPHNTSFPSHYTLILPFLPYLGPRSSNSPLPQPSIISHGRRQRQREAGCLGARCTAPIHRPRLCRAQNLLAPEGVRGQGTCGGGAGRMVGVFLWPASVGVGCRTPMTYSSASLPLSP